MSEDRRVRYQKRINFCFWLLGFALLVACPLYGAAQSSGTGTGPSQQGASPENTKVPADLKDRVPALEQKLDGLNNRIDSELRASNMRFEGAMRSTDRDFYILIAVGLLAVS